MLVVAFPSVVMVMVVEVACGACCTTIGLNDSYTAVACLKVVAYGLLHLGVTEVAVGGQVDVSTTIQTAAECDLGYFPFTST